MQILQEINEVFAVNGFVDIKVGREITKGKFMEKSSKLPAMEF